MGAVRRGRRRRKMSLAFMFLTCFLGLGLSGQRQGVPYADGGWREGEDGYDGDESEERFAGIEEKHGPITPAAYASLPYPYWTDAFRRRNTVACFFGAKAPA